MCPIFRTTALYQILCGLLICLIFTQCEPHTQQQNIVGVWENTQQGLIFQILPDSSYQFTFPNGAFEKGTFSIQKESLVLTTETGMSNKYQIQGIEEQQLQLLDGNGIAFHFAKKK